jgi:6-phosphogluconolactonase (cycloisomerase 2 family)
MNSVFIGISRIALALAIQILAGCGSGGGGGGSPAVLASIAISPASPTIPLGTNQSFAAVGTLTDGSTEDLTQSVKWSSSDESVLLLNNSTGRVGVANSRGPGSASVTATNGKVSGVTTASVVRRMVKFLYASVSGANIYGFRVDPATGVLSPVPGSPFAPTVGGTSIAVTRDFKFVYGFDNTGNLSGFAIGPDGSLTPVPGSAVPAPSTPVSLVADPSKDLLYVCGNSGDVAVFAIDPVSGVLTLTSSVTVRNAIVGPRADLGAITPDGGYFYGTSGTGPATQQVTAFSTDAVTGALTALSGGPVFTGDDFPETLAIDPAGKFLYVTIGNQYATYSTTVEGFSIDALSGTPTHVGSYMDGFYPRIPISSDSQAAIDASGRFLVVVGNPGGSVFVVSINPSTGALGAVPGSPFGAVSGGGGLVATDPSGLFVYIAQDFPVGISSFAMDQATGALSPIAATSLPGSYVSAIALTY